MTFRLLDLPAELRCLVYDEAITSGTMSILRASRQVNQEASPLIHKSGIFRILTEAYGNQYNIPTPPPTSNSIQNIEISVAIKGSHADYHGHDSGVLNTFTSAAAVVRRDTCYITFRMSILTSLHIKPERLLRSIKQLKGFKRIIATAIASQCEDYVGTQRAVIRARNKPTYEILLKELEPVFGPGIWHDAATQDGRYLEFHPQRS